MGESAKAITFVVAQMASRVIIAKLEGDRRKELPARERVEMGLANPTTLACANKDGLVNCAIKTSHGREN